MAKIKTTLAGPCEKKPVMASQVTSQRERPMLD